MNLCFQPHKSIDAILTTKLFSNIFTFNCLLAITSMLVLSLVAILAYAILSKAYIEIRWILVPIAISFLAFSMFFQQSFAAHLQGHSIFFALFFTIGIISLSSTLPWLNKSHPVSHMLFSILLFAVVINNIRVSFLTGING